MTGYRNFSFFIMFFGIFRYDLFQNGHRCTWFGTVEFTQTRHFLICLISQWARRGSLLTLMQIVNSLSILLSVYCATMITHTEVVQTPLVVIGQTTNAIHSQFRTRIVYLSFFFRGRVWFGCVKQQEVNLVNRQTHTPC